MSGQDNTRAPQREDDTAMRQTLRGLLGPQAMAHATGLLLLDLALARCAAEPPAPAQRAPGLGNGGKAAPGEPPLTMEAVLAMEAKLFALPEIYARLDALMKDPNTSASDVTALISKDPALSATMLKLVNSAFMGRTGLSLGHRLNPRVDNLERAVMILGTSQLANLALALSVVPAFRDIDPDVMDMRRFWEHSISCGLLARELALCHGGSDPEQAFVAGLLHDIGRLVMFRHLPGQCAQVLAQASREETDVYSVESRALGWTHADLGGNLLAKWQFPASLARAAAQHHRPGTAEVLPALVNAADFLAHVLTLGARADLPVPEFRPEAWDTLPLSAAALEEVVMAHDQRLAEITSSFFPT